MPNAFTYAAIIAPTASTAPAGGVQATSATVYGAVGDGGQTADWAELISSAQLISGT